ncbi:filamentous hemagglutinin N-terminal domain-containing protein [Caballeronia sp. LZ016]|uniref:two-partner secretion domain-containing protein n=1 Tax=Caballeronia sp. LZ016 TaxID=3038554 RepID=UPI0028631167|nr:filamentous hemagglutinin N-terminal domain-containing protein [Caballeronia sp. LZ016]MDR5740202.1 filamentous hemagglutinin N-terminal domain-containing protein [Caballeronia sp. LZ016]
MHTEIFWLGRPSNPLRVRRTAIGLVATGAVVASNAWAAGPMPSGGRFVAGVGNVSSDGVRMTVTQTTSRGVIDWSSFSIDKDHAVTIENGSGATLSRVTGTEASAINGALTASGSFYLINPQGVVIGANGVVTTGGRFIASTLDVNNDAFMAGGPLTFAGTGTGVVVNLGKITSTGGDVLLIARKLAENDGTISAPSGSAELAAGDQVLVRDSTGLPQTFVQSTGSRGDVVDKGTIAAAQIALQAADGNVYALAGNTNALRATGTATRDGHVWLVANDGTAHIHGRIEATNPVGGGTVETKGAALHLDDADVHAANWNLDAPVFNVGPLTTAALVRQLEQGTSLTLNASQGDIVMEQTMRWFGNASLTLNAVRSVTVGPMATLANNGTANLTLRADTGGQNNGGGVENLGTIDWSKSSGLVSSYRDGNGLDVAGYTRNNPAWTAPAYSGIRSQFTDYALVNTLDDLNKISQRLDGSFALGRDIDASPAGNNFQPIGSGTVNGFTGQLDGLGHTIANVTVSQDFSDTSRAGLFATIGDTGAVRNVKLANERVTVFYSPAGALAGQSSGLVSNVYADGSVLNQGSSGFPAGGLIGTNSGVIYRAGSDVAVSGPSLSGGLVGENRGAILQSFATGSAGGGSRAQGGGLAGSNSGSINQSYATGPVSGGNGEAGLVANNSGSIEQSFASGPVDTFLLPQYRGGIAANNTGVIAADVFWDRDATRQTSEYGAPTPVGTANGLTTGQMSVAASFGPTWDFGAGGTWAILPNTTHPILKWQVQQ